MKKPAFAFKPWLALVLCAAAAALFLMMSSDLPFLGDVQSPASQYLSGYYLENTLKDTLTPNAVTSIIVDYRAFDTLIETVVIFTAAIACLVIMRMKHD
jgi:multicomponent Na+:H+ antiporter subunit B